MTACCRPCSRFGAVAQLRPRLVLEDHLARFAQPGADGLVFTSPRGGPLRRAYLSEEWRKALDQVPAAPPGPVAYDLRHHAGTSAARSGATTKELMARMGHSSPRASLIYQHATAERDRAVADYLDAQIATAKPEPVAPVVPLKEAQ